MNELTSAERLSLFKTLTQGNVHVWSKNAYQAEKGLPILSNLLELGKTDPFFLAHFICMQDLTKDLQVLGSLANFHSDADGSKFSEESDLRKPNLRLVSSAMVQSFDPKLAHRVLWTAQQRQNGKKYFNHPMRVAFVKYLRYREENEAYLNSIVKAGFKEHIKNLYRLLGIYPSDKAASILRWKQRGKNIVMAASVNLFDGLSPKQVAEKITKENINFQLAMSQIANLTPAIGLALALQASPRQLAIYTNTWQELGLFNNEKFVVHYQSQLVKTGDETDRLNTTIKMEDKTKKIVEGVRSEQRKSSVSYAFDQFGIKKVFIHIDLSGSMSQSKDIAIDAATTVAEMIPDPANNLKWGWFNTRGVVLKTPPEFTKAGFSSVAYGLSAGGGTNIAALWPQAKEFDADLNIFVTDGDHTASFDVFNQMKGKYCLIIKTGNYHRGFHDYIVRNFNNVIEMTPEQFKGSNKVVTAFATALKGEEAIIDGVMATKLIELPKWWHLVPSK